MFRVVSAAVVFIFVLLSATRASAAPILDPAGDAFNGGAVDLTSYEFVFDGSAILVSMAFATPIAPPSTLAANSVFGYLDLDTDFDPSTGGDAAINIFMGLFGVPGLPVALGVDYYVNLSTELLHPGFVEVWDLVNDQLVATTAIAYGPSSLSFSLLPAWLGGATSFDHAILVGDLFGPTDRAPNEGVAVPEPAMLSLLGAGIAALAVARRRSSVLARHQDRG